MGKHILGGGVPTLPSAVFALAFVLLGWIAGHSIAYEVAGLGHHGGHGHHDPMHAYFDGLKLAGSVGLVIAFGLALRTFFRHGSFGEWLHEGGASGTRTQISLAAALPASVFVAAEHLERLAAGTGAPPLRLLAVGVLVQILVGLLCLALARFAFRVVERVIRSLSRRATPNRRPAEGPAAPDEILAHPPCPMAGSAAGRAPPLPIPHR